MKKWVFSAVWFIGAALLPSYGVAAYFPSNPTGTLTQLMAGITAAPTITSGGTTNATNDVLTLNDSCATHAKLNVTGQTSGVITSVSINTAGSCASPPVNPITVLSSTGTDTSATFTVAATKWGGTYTILAARFRICGVGAAGGGGGVSNVNGADASPGLAGTMLCAKYVGQTVGGTILYNLGIPGVGGAAGANNGTAGGNTVFGTITIQGGAAGKGSSSGNAAAGASINSLNTGQLVPLAPTSSIMITSEVLSMLGIGATGGVQGMSSPWGTGGTTAAHGTTGGNGTGYGAGGGSPSWVTGDSASGYAGGNGSGGALFVEIDQ